MLLELLTCKLTLAGIYDINETRARTFSEECGGIPVYDRFDRMMDDAKPDGVIVATVDAFHHEYIIKALEAGCDAITEKPMTIDEAKCRAILDAEKRTGKKVVVTFNCRFMPYMARIKELLGQGVIGKVLSVDLEWMLDANHSGEYFRRWHRNIEKSGGLLVHKSTHHFDLVNWWLEEEPEDVYAFGSRRFFGPTREKRGNRCKDCLHKDTCEFFWDITKDEFLNRYYVEAEHEDGYIRDGCVFDESINIYDHMSVNVKYSGGAQLTYSLITNSPYEGWKASLNGSDGRMEIEEFYSGNRANASMQYIKIFNRSGEHIVYEISKASGVHSGGDERLRRMIFAGDINDVLGQQANSWAGTMSCMIGISANRSILEKRVVNVKELLK